MGGVTPHGIRYPDGASKAKNLGPELKLMAEDIDTYIGSYLIPTGPIRQIIIGVAEEIVPPMVEELVPPIVEGILEEAGIEADPNDRFEVVDAEGAVAFSIDERGRGWIGDGIDSGRNSFEIVDADGALAFAVDANGTTYIGDGAGSGGGGGSVVTRVRAAIGAGQSLASGRGRPLLADLDTGHPSLWQVGHKSRNLRAATSPLDMMDSPSGISPLWVYGMEAARDAAPGEMIVVIPAGMGGTGLYSASSPNGCWNPSYTGPNRQLFNLMMDQIQDARSLIAARWPGVPVTWEAFLWNQGEYDAQQGVSEANYAATFDAVIEGVRAEVGNIPVIIGQSVREWQTTEAGAPVIQRAQIDTLARQDRTAFSYIVPNASNHEDLIHPNRGAVEAMGRAMYAARPDALTNVTGTSPVAPPDVQATVAGGTLTVTWGRPACHVTNYRVEYRVGSGSWGTISRSSPLHREATTSVASGAVQVRITTLDGTTESYTTTAITAIGS